MTVRTLFQRRLQAYAAFLGVSVQDLVRARRAYMSMDGYSYSLDGDAPYSDDYLSLGRRVSYDLYRDRDITIYGQRRMWGVFYDKDNEAHNEGLVVLHKDDPKVEGLHMVKGFYAEEEAVWGRYDDLLSDWRMGLYSYA